VVPGVRGRLSEAARETALPNMSCRLRGSDTKYKGEEEVRGVGVEDVPSEGEVSGRVLLKPATTDVSWSSGMGEVAIKRPIYFLTFHRFFREG
jgi:hypothetical protein